MGGRKTRTGRGVGRGMLKWELERGRGIREWRKEGRGEGGGEGKYYGGERG